MSDSASKPAGKAVPTAEEAAAANPNVDVESVREAQELLDELRKQGLPRPEYDIASPYERRPLRTIRPSG